MWLIRLPDIGNQTVRSKPKSITSAHRLKSPPKSRIPSDVTAHKPILPIKRLFITEDCTCVRKIPTFDYLMLDTFRRCEIVIDYHASTNVLTVPAASASLLHTV